MPILAWRKWWPVIEKLRLEWGWERPENSFLHFEYLALKLIHDQDSVSEALMGQMRAEMKQMAAAQG